jgi:superfamily II DNA or RNA helicase
MVKMATIRQRGPFISIGAPDGTPLDGEIYSKLAQPLVYTYRKQLFGNDAYDGVTGERQGIELETRRLYTFNSDQLLCVQKGWRSRMLAILKENGYGTEFFSLDEPKHPDTYRARFERVFERYDMRPKQDLCLAHIDMHDGGIIDAVPAFGKSYIMGMICLMYPKAKIDIVTKGKSVVATIMRHLSRYVANVGQVGAGKRRKSRVTVYTAQSLHHSNFDADIVLADEVHELMTDKFSTMLGRYSTARMYGFTGSKETRFDNAYARMEGLFGPTIFHMPYQEALRLGLVAPVIVQWLDVDMRPNPIANMADLVTRKKFGIWRNEYRNRIIANAATSFAEAGYQTLTLVETFDHGAFLRRWMGPEARFCYSEQCLDSTKDKDRSRREEYIKWGLMEPTERMTGTKRENMRRAFEAREYLSAIATGVWSVGVSFDELQVLVRAEGSGSETQHVQAPGRVLRIAENKQAGIIVDFWDQWDDSFLRKAEGRRRAYARNDWPQYMPNGKLWKQRTRSDRVGLRR